MAGFGGRMKRPFKFGTHYLDCAMESEEEVEFSDYEIEDLFKSNPKEYQRGSSITTAKNKALDESSDCVSRLHFL